MMRSDVAPVFVCRQTAAAKLEISVETFDTWVSAGFVPPAHIDRGQIMRWHWPSVETTLARLDGASAPSDPFMENIADVFGKKAKGRRRAAA